MKFFLDNCLAIRHARALNEMVKPEHEFKHLQDKFNPDVKDEDWIRSLGKEGGWIVISGDYRIGRSAHERAAWHESGLTIFFLKKGWTNISLMEQHAKLAHVLGEIMRLAKENPVGTSFSVALNGKIEKI